MFRNLIPLIFGVTMLLLGDGQQHVGVIIGAWGLIVLWWYFRRQKLLRPLPASMLMLWIGLVAYGIVSVFFSDSPGQSIYGAIRFIEAFLVYSICYSVSSRRTIESSGQLVVLATTIVTFISVVLLFYPSWQSIFVPMNLIYPSYGHNHLVNLIIFGLPMAFFLSNKHTALRYFSIGVMTVGLLLSYARGVLGVTIIGALLFVLFRQRIKQVVHIKNVLRMAAVVVLSVLLFTQLPLPNVRKSPAFPNVRGEYWLQAARAIQDKPLFGSGLNTFYIQSKKFETWTGQETWFAHNIAMESLVETGVVGSFLLTALIWTIMRHVIRFVFLDKTAKKFDISLVYPVFTGMTLTIIYAFIEFNLNFFVIWIMFFGFAGLLSGFIDRAGQSSIKPNPAQSVFTSICIALLCVFSTSATFGKLLAVYGGSPSLIFFITPYQKSSVKNFLANLTKEKKSPTRNQENVILYLHHNDGDVLYVLAQNYEISKSIEKARNLYHRVLDLDPHNASHRETILDFYLQRDFIDDLRVELVARSGRGLDKKWTPKLYGLGYQLYDQGKPQDTVIFWKVASLLSPSSSHMWIEYASLLLASGDQSAARSALIACQKDSIAGPHCKEAMYYFDINEFPPVGFYRKIIEDKNL